MATKEHDFSVLSRGMRLKTVEAAEGSTDVTDESLNQENLNVRDTGN